MKKVYLISIFFIFLFINITSATQTYLNESYQWWNNLSEGIYTAMTWGDINEDGYTDLILIGHIAFPPNTESARIYINNRTSLVENSTWQQNLTAVSYGSLSLGDIDNDGDLDLALSGCNNGASFVDNCDSGSIRTIIYINNGTSFTESSQWQGNLTAVYRPGSLTFGDIDNDGDLDLALNGQTESSITSKIYLNNGSSFTESSQWQSNLTALRKASLVFGDIDNDRDLDLIISGRDSSNQKLTEVYLNNGTSFIESSQWQNNLVNVEDSSLALADFDNDGDLDLSLFGCCDIHRIYRNNGSTFIEINRESTGNLVGVFAGSQAFGDYDNDGYLDLITNGREKYTTLYLYNLSIANFTNDIFAETESHVANVMYGSLAWIDLENDTDLDLIETGYDSQVRDYVYISNRSLTKNNTLPTPPNIFTANYYVENNTLVLGWGNGSDNETPSAGLYYNLIVGNSTTNHTIVSGVYGGSSNPTAGYFGNMMQRKNITLNLVLPNGTYYWYVQTIDTGLAKSNWSERQSFSFGADTNAPTFSSIASSVTSSTATITWDTNESSNSSVYYGTTNATTSFSGSASWTLSHSISLSGLSASTLYYYNVSSCDDSGNCNTSTQSTFTTSASGGGNGGGGGGGGSSRTTVITPTPEVKEFDIDFSSSTSGNLEVRQGDVKTFSFNGEIKHSITILTLTTSSMTLLITSEPITLQINVGETKQIDINQDKMNDIEINLVSIISGKANIYLTKLEGADIVAEEEIEKEIQKEALFDVNIDIVNLFRFVKTGREVIAQIEVLNVNNIGQVDVVVDYYITDKENNTITSGSDTLAVEAVASFVRSLRIPYNLKAGRYFFNIDVKYKDMVRASGSVEFLVIKTYEIFIAAGVIVLIILGIFFYLWRIKKKEEKLEKKERRDIRTLKREIKELKKKSLKERFKKWQKTRRKNRKWQ